jgi:hypothetical protein
VACHEVTEDQFNRFIAAIERTEALDAEAMPDDVAALRVISRAKERLRELGWRDGLYAPKDGTVFDTCEAGSTGIFDCYYSGVWPEGHWLTFDGGDCYPSSSPPMMFRLKPQPEAA